MPMVASIMNMGFSKTSKRFRPLLVGRATRRLILGNGIWAMDRIAQVKDMEVRAGQRTQTMFSSVDIMPTLLGLAGVDAPDGMQGTDLSQALLGEDGPEADSVYLQILGPGWPHRGEWVGFWRGVRTQRWVYARWFGSGECWLFDRENDPYELENLAGNPEYTAIQQQLEQRLQQWIGETDDPFETGNRDSATGILQLGQSLTR